jgi:Tetratricopeptide repeat
MSQPQGDRIALTCRHIKLRNLAIILPQLVIILLSAGFSSGEFHGRAADLIPQSLQEPGGAGNEKDLGPLEPGKPSKRELSEGEQHSYQIRLTANQFLKVVIVQNGIDLVIKVLGPDGREILEIDQESRLEGREEVALVAEQPGSFRLKVRPRQKGAPKGSYEIRVEDLRAATERDLALDDAQKQIEKSRKLRRAGKYDEALPPAERALAIRERLLGPEHQDLAVASDAIAGIYINKGEYARAEPLSIGAR